MCRHGLSSGNVVLYDVIVYLEINLAQNKAFLMSVQFSVFLIPQERQLVEVFY